VADVSAVAPSAATPTIAPIVQAPAQTLARTAGGRIKISPLAKKTASKMGVDYSRLSGSGSGGRIVQKDILSAQTTAAEAPASPSLSLVNMGIEMMDGDEIVKVAGMRKAVAHRMFKSHTESPTVTTTSKVDVTKLLAFRKSLAEETGRKYSLNDFILKAVAKALRNNSRMLVSWNGESIIKRAHVNLGMAVALDEGLIVPVIRDADRLGLDTLSNIAQDFAQRARDGKLNPDEYQGSTFTISNMGMMDIESFTPIINQPDAAILGVCAIQDELDMDDAGTLFKRKVMRLSLTWDHRLVDGSDAAKFQKDIKSLLEKPMSILL